MYTHTNYILLLELNKYYLFILFISNISEVHISAYLKFNSSIKTITLKQIWSRYNFLHVLPRNFKINEDYFAIQLRALGLRGMTIGRQLNDVNQERHFQTKYIRTYIHKTFFYAIKKILF